MEGIVHQERYEHFDDARIRQTYHERETEGWKRYMTYPELAARISGTGVENLAQIYTQLKYRKSDNETISTALLNGLRRQGFLPRGD